MPLARAKRHAAGKEKNGSENNSAIEIYREIIKDNIDYDNLIQNCKIDKDRLDEIVDLMLETVCTAERQSVLPGTITPPNL